MQIRFITDTRQIALPSKLHDWQLQCVDVETRVERLFPLLFFVLVSVAWRVLQLMIESKLCHAVPKEIIQMIILLNWTTWHEAMGQRMNDTEFVG